MTVADVRSCLFRLVEVMTRSQKRAVLLAVDVIVAPLSLLAAFALLSTELVPLSVLQHSAALLALLPPLAGITSVALGLHRVQLKAYELDAILKTAVLALLLSAFTFIMAWAFALQLPLVGTTLFGLFFFLAAVGSRVAMLRLLVWILSSRQHRTRVLIYGAGTTGMQLAAALKNHESIRAVAFVDDNIALHSTTVAGLHVLSPTLIRQIARERDIDRVLLAMPSESQPKQARIARRLKKMGLDVLTVPSFAQLVGTETLVDHLAPVIPGKFLGRKPVDTLAPEEREAVCNARNLSCVRLKRRAPGR